MGYFRQIKSIEDDIREEYKDKWYGREHRDNYDYREKRFEFFKIRNCDKCTIIGSEIKIGSCTYNYSEEEGIKEEDSGAEEILVQFLNENIPERFSEWKPGLPIILHKVKDGLHEFSLANINKMTYENVQVNGEPPMPVWQAKKRLLGRQELYERINSLGINCKFIEEEESLFKILFDKIIYYLVNFLRILR